MRAIFKPLFAKYWLVDSGRSFRVTGYSRSGASVWLAGIRSPVPVACVEVHR